jgi:streptogramin lyase
MKIKLPPRPSGEAARVVFREYDVPRDPESVPDVLRNDGSDWSLGTPSRIGSLPHDAWLDQAGDIWFTSNVPNRWMTIGRIFAKSGELKLFRVPNTKNSLAANTHGMTRDPTGIIWFNANNGRGSLGRVDPKTEQIDIYTPPEPMSPTGGATTVDYDGQGKIWVSSTDGALRFDPDSKTFTEFKSVTFKTANGTGITYGAAADRDGNGWWAEMTLDIIGRGDGKTGQSQEIKLAPVAAESERVTPDERKFYATFNVPDFNTPFPWSQGPRRMGTDKNDDVLWVGNSWGGTLARINTRTLDTTFVPLPGSLQPYHATVDAKHNVWLNLWTTDAILKYDPAAKTFTRYDMPTRGSEARYISLHEGDGALQVVVPSSRTSKIAVMSFRSEADLQALKARADQQR